MTFTSIDEAEWDADLAADLVGSSLLVGLTYLDELGQVIRREQIFGTVVSCDPIEGIAIRSATSDEDVVIAPVLEAISVADPGVYQLRDVDMAVEDPDFIATLSVKAPRRS